MEALKLDSFRSYRFLSNLKCSPAGGRAAFVVGQANGENGYDFGIWQWDGQKVSRLTTQGGEKNFLWLDEGHLLFPAVRSKADKKAQEAGEEETTFYRISLTGGEAEEAFRVPLRVTAFQRLGEEYLLTAIWDGTKVDARSMSEEEKAAHKYDKDYQVVDELPYWFNGVGFTNKKRSRLYRYNPADGKVTPITGEKETVGRVRVSPCGRYAYYTCQPFDGVQGLTDDLRRYDSTTGESAPLLTGRFSIREIAPWGEQLILAGSEMKTYGMNENPHFYALNPADGTLTLLMERDTSIGESVGSDCRLGGGETFQVVGDSLYYTALVGNAAELYRFDLSTKKEEQLTHCAGSVDCFGVAGEGILAIAMVGLRLQELYRLEGGALLQLSTLNEGMYTDFAHSTPEPLSFVEGDGYTIDGWVLPPVDYIAGKGYPAILNIHGGPRTAFGTLFFHEMQYWANLGYFVLFCNPRGSSGKGNAFAEVRGAYGTYDYENLMTFVDHCLTKYPAIDKERLGVTGGSYGGFMTNWIIGHTHRFKAAASQRSISNWISFGYTSDIGYYFGADQMAATPWSDFEKLWWHSPLKYADQAKTPTLFIHSDEDYRCWIPEGYQMFSALKVHGVESRMCVFHGENHELSRSGKPEHRVRRLSEITNWFEERLK